VSQSDQTNLIKLAQAAEAKIQEYFHWIWMEWKNNLK
jgi:hypothetical protein